MSLVLEIAFTHVRARLRQTLVAIAGVATGVAFSVMMAALMQGSQNDFIRQLVDTLPHIAITDERPHAPPQPAEKMYEAADIKGLTLQGRRPGIKNPLALMAQLEEQIRGHAAPSVQARAILRYAGRDVSASIIGIDPAREGRVSVLPEKLREGSLSALYRAGNAVILGSRLAQKMGVRVGSTLTMTTTTGGTLDAEVVGIFHLGMRMSDETTGYVLMRTAQILLGQTAIINEIRIRLEDPLSAKAVADRMAQETGYKAVAWIEAQEDLLSAFRIRNTIMYTVVGAILLVASFGTWNIISTITHEKARDIAIMKSLGLTQATVRVIFVVEAAVIGAIGMLVGWLLGWIMCVALGSIEFRFNAFTDMTHLPMEYNALHYLIAGGVALASSLLAGYFPARKAARVHPVDIIRGAT